MAAHNELGRWGEIKAAEYLQQKGYVILHRDWKYKRRDLDIVAFKDDTCVIVEVKARADAYIMAPEMAVDRQKVRSIMVAANAYIKLYRIDKDIRFDIISIVGSNENDISINHIEDAFMPIPY